MPQSERRVKSCSTGKRCFGTRQGAINFAMRTMLRAGNDDKYGYIRAYRCKCGWWHLTSHRPR